MSIDSKLMGDRQSQVPSDEAVDKLLMPQAVAPEKLSQTTKLLVMVVISLLIFFLPLFLLTIAVSEDAKNMNADLGFVRTSLTQVPTPIPAIQKLMTPIAQTQGQINQFNAVYPTLTAPRANWSSIMGTVGKYDPNQISLAAITRTANSLTITGNAINDSVVSAYAHALEESNVFSRVVVQSFHALTITPTVQLTKTATVIPMSTPIVMPVPTNTSVPKYVYPTTVPISSSVAAPTQPTPTPDLRDIFEPDENQPKPIAMGQAQSHNFYPDGDVDAVYFLAKMGRYYHVYTTNLAPGVDTYLTVRSGALLFTNDDATPGSLYSEIYYQHLGADTSAIIWISNRATFGSGKTYQIVVEEYVPTPTPLPTSTTLPTATRTRIPTATPTSLPTATPDSRDPYEPDDVDAKPISIGETQAHNFYPSGDIDKVSFPVKTSRFYQVLTSDLALGVDTLVTVNLGNSATWVNDDYAPGTGNFASAVCFQAPQDGTAIATIVNKANQYGGDKTYRVRVSEIPTLYTAPCVQPTPTVKPPAILHNAGKMPGLAALIWSSNRPSDDVKGVSLPALTIQFIIIADIKVPAP